MTVYDNFKIRASTYQAFYIGGLAQAATRDHFPGTHKFSERSFPASNIDKVGVHRWAHIKIGRS